MSARQARPLRRRPEPAPASFSILPQDLAPKRPQSGSRVCGGWPPARRAGRGAAGLPALADGGSPGAAGSRGSRRETRRRGGSGGGPGGSAGVAGEGGFVIVFVSERSEFVTPVPLPPPPARWEEEGECSSSSSQRQPHRGRGGRASTRLAEPRARTGTPQPALLQPALLHPALLYPAPRGPLAGRRREGAGVRAVRRGASGRGSAGTAFRRNWNLRGEAATVVGVKSGLGVLKTLERGPPLFDASSPLPGNQEFLEAGRGLCVSL